MQSFVTSRFFAVFLISLKIGGEMSGFTKLGKESEEPSSFRHCNCSAVLRPRSIPNLGSTLLASARTLAATTWKTAVSVFVL